MQNSWIWRKVGWTDRYTSTDMQMTYIQRQVYNDFKILGGFYGGRKESVLPMYDLILNFVRVMVEQGFVPTDEAVFSLLAWRYRLAIHSALIVQIDPMRSGFMLNSQLKHQRSLTNQLQRNFTVTCPSPPLSKKTIRKVEVEKGKRKASISYRLALVFGLVGLLCYLRPSLKKMLD